MSERPLDPRALLSTIKARLEPAFGSRLRGAVLYGSIARREETVDSDVDVLVLLDEPIRLLDDLRKIVSATFELELDLDRPIHATPASFRSYEAGTFALYRNAKREGILL